MAEYDVEPYKMYKFEVELVDGPIVGGFEKVSGLTMQMETVEYREGGVNDHVHSLPGQYHHKSILLESGIVNEDFMFQWFGNLKWGHATVAESKSNVQILIRHADGDDDRWGFEIFDAYPIQWDGPDMRAKEAEGQPALQTVELAHSGFTNLEGTPGPD